MATIHLESTSQTPNTPDAGWIRLWSSGTTIKYITSDGTVRTLSTGITREEVEDLLENSFNDSTYITWTYDDNANSFTAQLSQAVLDQLQNALQDGDGISRLTNDMGFETPAQLSNRDQQNRNRANHIGTQTASTISDLSQAIATYLDRKPIIQIPQEPNFFSINTTTSPSIIVNQDYTPLHTGNYLVEVDFGHSYDSTNDDNIIELLVNNSVVRSLQLEPKESGGDDGNSGTDQRDIGRFSYKIDAVANVPFNVKFQHYAQANGRESTIKGLTLKVSRWL